MWGWTGASKSAGVQGRLTPHFANVFTLICHFGEMLAWTRCRWHLPVPTLPPKLLMLEDNNYEWAALSRYMSREIPHLCEDRMIKDARIAGP